MGIAQLWKTFETVGAITQIAGNASEGAIVELAKAIERQAVAVDLSVWLVEAQTQGQLVEVCKGDMEACRIKLCFERICTWLRFGVTPVLVIDGPVTAAKAGRLRERYNDFSGISLQNVLQINTTVSLSNNPQVKPVKALADAMGIPVVQAPGEAEAMCAALDAAGLVSGVQSKDVDSLLFGAKRVYKQLRLVSQHKMCEMVVCDANKLYAALGLKSGGKRALQVVGVLAGGDYNVDGVDQVGSRGAWDTVATLLKRQQDPTDDRYLEATLMAALREGPDPHLQSLNHCTGCRNCGHESGAKNSKATHGRGGCVECGTTHACVPKPKGKECQCEFHRRRGERHLSKVLEKASRLPSCVTEMKDALAEYTRQCEAAETAAKRFTAQQTRWYKRPDCQALVAVFDRYTSLEWKPEVIRLKLRPVLMEWDLLQGPAGALGVEWRPHSIQKVQGLSGKDPSTAWQFILNMERIPGVGTPEEELQDREWLKGVVPRQVAQADDADMPGTSTQPTNQRHDADEEDDQEGGSQSQSLSQGAAQVMSQGGTQADLGVRKVGKTAPVQQRTFRISLVASKWPQLYVDYRLKQEAKLKPKPKASGRKAKAPANGASQGQLTLMGTPASQQPAPPKSSSSKAKATVDINQPTIHSFLRTQKPTTNTAANTSKLLSAGACSTGSARQLLQDIQGNTNYDNYPDDDDGDDSSGPPAQPASTVHCSQRGCQSEGAGMGGGEKCASSNLHARLLTLQQAPSGPSGTQLDSSTSTRQGANTPPRRAPGLTKASGQGAEAAWHKVPAPIIDLCTPSPVGKPMARSGAIPGAALATMPQQQRAVSEVIDLCSSDDEDGEAGHDWQQSPSKRGAQQKLRSPSKRACPD